MRIAFVLALGLAGCTAVGSTAPLHTLPPAQPTRATPAGGCQPTQTKDASGVITTDGRTGIVGETFASGDLLRDGTSVVRRGSVAGDRISVRFDQIGSTAPATWVAYDVDATPVATPWGTVVFRIGWKPIAFEDSCWRLIVDGADTGIVLAIGH